MTGMTKTLSEFVQTLTMSGAGRRRRRNRRHQCQSEVLESRTLLAATYSPVARASIQDANGDGTGDSFEPVFPGLIRHVGLVESRAIAEFDLNANTDTVNLAVFDFNISNNNAAGNQVRLVDISIYAGDGQATLDDFAATGQFVSTITFNVPLLGDTFRLNVTSAVQQVLNSGNNFVSVQARSNGDNFPLVMNAPELTINGVAPARGHRGWQTTSNAIRTDGVDSFRLEVDTGGDVNGVVLDTATMSQLLIAPGTGRIALYDDGLNGDRVAGDSVYTSGEFRYNTSQPLPDFFGNTPDSPRGVAIADLGNVLIEELDGTEESQFLIWPEVGLLSTDIPNVSVQQLSPQVQVSPHLINVQTEIVATQSSMRDSRYRMSEVANAIYDVLPDEFDFLNFFSIDHVELAEKLSSSNFSAGVHDSITVDWAGSLQGQRQGASAYGSDGRLLGVNLFDTMSRGIYGYNATHELVHQWSAYYQSSLGITRNFGHFNPYSSAASLVGGQEWIANTDGSYTINFDEGYNGAQHASPWDLYMMGLIDKDQVPDILMYNSTATPKSAANPVVLPSEITRTVTVEDVIAVHGERETTGSSVRRDFRIGFVAESHQRQLSTTEMTFYEVFAAHYTRTTPNGEADPYVGFGWSSIDRFFGNGTTWDSLIPGQSETLNTAPEAQSASHDVPPGSPNGTLVGTVIATDADSGQTLRFAIIGGNEGQAFQIDPVTGAVTVAKSASLALQEEFVLQVRVTDNGTPQQYDTAAVTILIQSPNQAPVVNDQTFAVSENSANETIVGTVVATDADNGQSLTYTITAGNNGAFAINASTGRITVVNSALLDFETLPQVNLTVAVADNGNPSLSDTAAIRIDITDVVEITGDLKPGDATNTLNPSSDAKFQIVLFSTATFDANSIDVRSLRFGATGSEDSVVRQKRSGTPTYAYQDLNGDGRLDLVVTFQLNKTGLTSDSTIGVLTGSLLDGTTFELEFSLKVLASTKGGGKSGGGKKK